MNSIHIDKDGNISFPPFGDMKITIEMTEDIFEEFMQFRKSKEEYEKKFNELILSVRNRTNALAQAVIDSVDGKTPKDRKEAKEEALELANDWFA